MADTYDKHAVELRKKIESCKLWLRTDDAWPTYYGQTNEPVPYGMKEYWPGKELKPVIAESASLEAEVKYPRTGDLVDTDGTIGHIVWVKGGKVAVRYPGSDGFPEILDKDSFRVYSHIGSRRSWQR